MAETKSNFLQIAYNELDLLSGDLINISERANYLEDEILNKGQWINVCIEINKKNDSFRIDKILFVENNPVIIFVDVEEGKESEYYKIFNQIWCIAKPRFLFIGSPYELFVLDLASKPVKDNIDLRPLEVIRNLVDISDKLENFKLEKINSGEVFHELEIKSNEFRADKTLIDDLKILRDKLFNSGLKNEYLKYAHALIGRSIFIRYLEDREILTSEYFKKIAKKNPAWSRILNQKADKQFVYPEMTKILYPKVLKSKEFTYELYKQLSADFNGDIFPTDDYEESVVKQKHLDLLAEFLFSDLGQQKNIFLWAYKFDIIPIELISNIYEEFYHYENQEINESKKSKRSTDKNGTHYTPSELVDYILSKVLTSNSLKSKPTVLDPACGSGIFLVEAFKRIVRYELFKQKKKSLSFEALSAILKNQIRGIELNPEAINITAFSLYVAFLHFQDPPAILPKLKKGNRLPRLICSENIIPNSKEVYHNILLNQNTFEIDNFLLITKKIETFSTSSIDIVIGNPPWGELDRKQREAMVRWCRQNNKPISDDEPSQAFIWRSLEFLKPKGYLSLLVSSGIFFKHSDASNLFKVELLKNSYLKEVINFVHVRDLFFNKGISPFVAVVIQKNITNHLKGITYISIKRSRLIDNFRCVFIDKTDIKHIKYSQITDDVWKIFWFGNERDLSLIEGIRLFPRVRQYVLEKDNSNYRRQGFIKGNEAYYIKWLQEFDQFPIKYFNYKYGNLDFTKLTSTQAYVERIGDKKLFSGKRILIKRGITEKNIKPKGQIIARYETKKFAFTNAINCIQLESNSDDDYKILIGIFWSSLCRYYFFMTGSTWGTWHHEIHLEEILNFPIVFPDDKELKEEIIRVVNLLREEKYNTEIENGQTLLSFSSKKKSFDNSLGELEDELDKLIYQLYFLTDSEADLVRNRCKYDIDFFYNDLKSIAYAPVQIPQKIAGLYNDVKRNKDTFSNYLKIFLKSWNAITKENKQLKYHIINSKKSNLLGVIFSLEESTGEVIIKYNIDSDSDWESVLSKISKRLVTRVTKHIYKEGIFRYYSPSHIILIKRNEERLWTETSAREDIDATILQAIKNNQTSND